MVCRRTEEVEGARPTKRLRAGSWWVRSPGQSVCSGSGSESESGKKRYMAAWRARLALSGLVGQLSQNGLDGQNGLMTMGIRCFDDGRSRRRLERRWKRWRWWVCG